MLLVVADTGPLRYLVLIGQTEILPQLFEKIIIPTAVYGELCHPSAPDAVRQWAESNPAWIEVVSVTESPDPSVAALDPGERAAISLAMIIRADLILSDDRKASIVAVRRGFEKIGTLGLLTRAAQYGHLDLDAAIEQLKQTNLHYRQQLLDELMKKYGRSKS